jgi:hypothetical protein
VERKGRNVTVIISNVIKRFDRLLIWLSKSAHARESNRRRNNLPKHSCEFAACKETAVHHVKWGESTNQQGNLCEAHMREVWEKVHTQVTFGLNWWQQSLPK